jgi:hypothetical protein
VCVYVGMKWDGWEWFWVACGWLVGGVGVGAYLEGVEVVPSVHVDLCRSVGACGV